MPQSFDVIVLGVGGMGSATVFELARRGRRVLGLEQFGLVHERGSSHGQTRIIRKAYYEHPSYVPLAHRAYEGWYDLEQRSNRRLLVECGCLSLGLPDGRLLSGIRRSADEHGLAIDRLTASEVRARYPAWQLGDEYAGIFERSAGFLYVEECVHAFIEAARACGATMHSNEPVRAWQANATGVTVLTDRDTYHADRLILTAGPWAIDLMQAELGLTLMRQVLFWFGTADPGPFRRDRFGTFIVESPEGNFYGFPQIDKAGGLKVAQHYGAAEVTREAAIERLVHRDDEIPVRAFLTRHLPAANGPCLQARTCIYTLTPDRHFVLDRHPGHANVVIASPCSGHGYKFAPVIGTILADLAEQGSSSLPIDFFRLDRLRTVR